MHVEYFVQRMFWGYFTGPNSTSGHADVVVSAEDQGGFGYGEFEFKVSFGLATRNGDL